MSDAQFGVRQAIGAPVAKTRLAEQAVVCIPPRSAKFTLTEWKLNNDARCRNAEDQQQLAGRVVGECQRIRDQTKENAQLLKETTDRRLDERIGDVEFNKNELMVQRKEIYNELEALGVYKTRLQDCLASLQINAVTICRKCLMLRDGRLGIDLVVDGVEAALQREMDTILGGQSLLKRALEQLNEQMRRLRSTRYQLDRDLQYKQAAIDSDKGSLSLNSTDLCLSVYEGYVNLDPADISVDEYNAYSAKNVQQAAREVTSARPIRIFIDTLLKQVIEDLWVAYNRCNHEFNERIKETKIAKAKLEEVHHDTTQKICDLQDNILELQKALSEKEGYIGLAHTRLGRRAQRVGAELVKDPPGQSLFYECENLRHSTEQLQQMLQEATASLRYLLQTQLQLEEDINVKMNTLKIDEVDCMTLSVFEASQSLFWASFGMVGLENFELAGIKSYTRFWGLLMFGSYSVINVIVLLNLLIAMMSNSYAMITEHSDVEWKFARTRLWMSYFEESATLPPPFNIFPTPKLLMKMLGLRKKDKLARATENDKTEKESDVRYTAVMRALVWRYVSAMHRKMDDEPVTEDDVNELKGDVSALRYELLEVFEKNGMDVSFTDRKEKAVLGKRMKVWERRLMKDFHVAPVALEEEGEKQAEDGLSKFRRLAKLAVASTSNAKWDQTLMQTGISSQIGRCRSRESFKNQQNLQKAMDEARKLVMRSPLPEGSRGASPIDMPVTPGHSLMELIKDFSEDVGPTPDGGSTPVPKSPWKPPGAGNLLGAAMKSPCRGSSPKPRTTTPGPLNMGILTKTPSPAVSPQRIASAAPSPTPRPVSPVPEEFQPEPSPLKGKRVPGDTPPKVIKRKSGTPGLGDDQAPAEEVKPLEDIAVARPVAPEIKPTEGAIPPPPAPVKSKAPAAPTMEVTPSTPPKSPTTSAKLPSPPKSPAPSAKPSSPPKSPAPSAKSSSPPKSPVPSAKSSSPPKSPAPSAKSSPPRAPSPVARAPTPQTSAPPRSPTPPGPSLRLSSTSSTEQLLPPASPEPLRPQKKIEEVKTIKRQPKTGWL